MQNILDLELQRIDDLPKLGVTWVEYSAYALGINIAPRKRSSRPCGFLIQFIIANYNVSFEAYVEAVLLTFQLSVGLVKMMHFHNFMECCAELLSTTERGDVLKNLGLFELALPHKQALRKTLGSILTNNWQVIDRQVMFFFKIVCMPVLYYTMRPYFQYIYDCYIVKDTCEMTLTYPAIVPFIQLGKHEYPSYSIRFFLLQSGPFWCFFAVFGFNSLFVVLTRHEACLLEILRYLVQHSTEDDVVPQPLRVSLLIALLCLRFFL
ncbi:hypothetical protein ACLKA6_018487 [Drosophila palustris]